MKPNDIVELLRSFPESPQWVLDRDWSLKDARNVMIERRRVFPGTAPMTREQRLASELNARLKGWR